MKKINRARADRRRRIPRRVRECEKLYPPLPHGDEKKVEKASKWCDCGRLSTIEKWWWLAREYLEVGSSSGEKYIIWNFLKTFGAFGIRQVGAKKKLVTTVGNTGPRRLPVIEQRAPCLSLGRIFCAVGSESRSIRSWKTERVRPVLVVFIFLLLFFTISKFMGAK